MHEDEVETEIASDVGWNNAEMWKTCSDLEANPFIPGLISRVLAVKCPPMLLWQSGVRDNTESGSSGPLCGNLHACVTM